ncbi:MAG: acyl-CoA dehydrogenase family protein [Polyangiaceae bacterium]|jgi:acyl-CoA dehydrogenase
MLDFAEEHKVAQKAIRTWARGHLAPKVARLESGEELPYPLMRELGATFGIVDMVRAQFARMREGGGSGGRAFGGSGGESPLMAILMMELSRVCPGFALAFGASLGLCGGAILSRGTLAQKERFALPVMTMEKIGAWALTEPGAGSDAFGSMKTHARKADGGWRLTGSKTFITNAPHADTFVVYARMPGDSEVRAFIVERRAKGVATGAAFKKMGMHASPTGELFLDDVFVPADQLLGGDDTENARAAVKSSLKGERFGMTPMALGIVDRCLEESVRYAKDRLQWGKPIATFQLVQEKIARMYVVHHVIHALLMRRLEAERAGTPLSVEEASASKLYCAQMTTEVAMEAVQLKGGAGYMQEGIVEMLARDAKLLQIGGGTDEIQILRIAREVLERA